MAYSLGAWDMLGEGWEMLNGWCVTCLGECVRRIGVSVFDMLCGESVAYRGDGL